MLIALLVALATGIAISAQVTLSTLTGQIVGPVRTGFLLHLAGAIVSLGIMAILELTGQGVRQWGLNRAALTYMLMGGFVGISIVAGGAFALPRTGLAAGQVTIIMGQMLVSVILDTRGWGLAEPMPLEPRRIAGLLLMAAAAFLLIPRQ